ncbi:uncharacterized protein LOC114713964 [Neltuma alba]|uniref:uncharacterized protein LOC114713964 n=1 Tax=Neltuma alba TaxID=207710 RepID=UPI0010A57F68|nr:uncharacterized protein LOC114713964 [Prosopis alba]
MTKKSKSKDGQRARNFSGYILFTEEFYEQNKKKFKSFEEGTNSVKKAWGNLTEEEKEQYGERAKEMRVPPKGKNYIVPFHTRCAPGQFMEVCKQLKKSKEKMERLKRIGFDKLVDICCSQIYRDFCGELIRVFDPVSRQISIRGKTHLVGPEDVNELMGLPFKGEDIKINVENEDETFKKLRSDYGKVPYKTIGTWLIEGKEEEKFEFLFVMYALGVLLCPGSSVWVSDKVLKVMVVTKDSLGHYDWSSLVLKEFCNSIAEFKKGKKKGKADGTKNVGGCMYFLMIYCLQHFPLGKEKAAKNENAITYWDEEKVKARVKSEKNSDRGILHGVPSVGGASTSASNTGIKLTHPVSKSCEAYFGAV